MNTKHVGLYRVDGSIDETHKKVVVTDLGDQYQIVVEEAIEVKDE